MAQEHPPLRLGRWLAKSAAAGLLGGLVMILLQMASMAYLSGALDPLHRIAATFEAFRPPGQGYLPVPLAVGLFLHMAVSAFWALLLGLLVWRYSDFLDSQAAASWTGGVYGMLVWVMMGRWIGLELNPAVSDIPSLLFLAAHLIYGFTAAWLLYTWSRSRELPALRNRTRERDRELGVQPT